MVEVVDSAERIFGLIAQFEPRLQRRFVQLMESVKDDIVLERVASLLAVGQVGQALGVMERVTVAFAAEVNAALVLAGTDTARVLSEATRTLFTFNERGLVINQVLQDNQFRLVTGLTESQREASTVALQLAIERGTNPREAARALRESIGLTRLQVESVANYRRLLEQGSAEALRRQLRDRRFDRSVERALRTGEPIPADRIDRMVARYAERALQFRAETVAQTEALRSANFGNMAMYDQAIFEGEIDPQTTVRTWITAGDERVRGAHSVMSGQQRGPREPFISGAGSRLMFPGDPNAPASETVRCRCAVATRINIERNDT